MSQAVRVDRAALVRRALVELVADKGFRGTSMAAVAERAGVATGTAYVHYRSKGDLVLAAYMDVKAALMATAVGALDERATPQRKFTNLWRAIYDHLANDPVRARFLVQVESSPYAAKAHEAAMSGDELLNLPAMEDVVARFLPLPVAVLYDLGLGPAVRLVASEGVLLDNAELEAVAKACWRAVSGE